ncbi:MULTISPECIES: mycofactocin precursor MftA [Paenarthrobacter]|jgi:mycofactocin precursor|uniref:Mycofactocin MftA n=1 Tax=Paenarthrobacter aromaticivorans TaxID=2849150 RepID=A0ABS6I9W1_9MICC|nr:mycofactocin precursor MftA [Paenarthrobacter sp. MMS21-TAE1-1]MBU8868513.1 mycofactocin precursor MftA [Paenarthrobacter sp. MMS21-TAE1-1]
MEYVNPNLETSAAADKDTELVAEDLIEDVSIDGMCGVY